MILRKAQSITFSIAYLDPSIMTVISSEDESSAGRLPILCMETDHEPILGDRSRDTLFPVYFPSVSVYLLYRPRCC